MSSCGTLLLHYVRKHLRRIAKSLAISLPITLAGYGLLLLLVSHWGMKPTYGNMTASPIMAFVGYVANKKTVFPDRSTGFLRGLRRWFVKSGSLGFVSQSTFIVLVGIMGMPYQPVRICIILALALPSFALANGWIFPEAKRGADGVDSWA